MSDLPDLHSRVMEGDAMVVVVVVIVVMMRMRKNGLKLLEKIIE
jgi:hypothetical protein